MADKFFQLPDDWQLKVAAGLDAVYPPQCAFCGRVCEQSEPFPGICRQCLVQIPFRHGGQSRLEWCDGAATDNCRPESGLYCATQYSGQIRSALRRFKFADAPDLATALASILMQAIRKNKLDCKAVMAVPLHSARLRERGYNQAGLLAERIACQLDRPDWSDCLKRIRATDRQSSQPDRGMRRLNLAGAFALTPDFIHIADSQPQWCQPLPILLIDDILTTGTTLTEAARPLWQAGQAVTGLVIASEHRPKEKETSNRTRNR